MARINDLVTDMDQISRAHNFSNSNTCRHCGASKSEAENEPCVSLSLRDMREGPKAAYNRMIDMSRLDPYIHKLMNYELGTWS